MDDNMRPKQGDTKMGFNFTIPDYKKIRVIIDTDAACEADDPFAIAINPGCGHYHDATAPLILEDTSSEAKEDNPKIRIYTDADSRYILEDFISKLEIFTE